MKSFRYDQKIEGETMNLSTRMKFYEGRYTQNVFLPQIPIIARIDGRCFSKFTSGLEKPYDLRMSSMMIEVTKYLVEETGACCGYTQSDEISLIWINEEIEKEFFGSKLLKMTSVIASMATAKFNKLLPEKIPQKQHLLPVFDNRIWQVPSKEEATNYLIWREQDAVRNSVQLAARTKIGHSLCQNKDCVELKAMLLEKGIDWKDYPAFFRQGSYVLKKTIERGLTEEEIKDLPPKHNALKNPNLQVKRTLISCQELPLLKDIANRVDVIFNASDVVLK